MEITVKVDGVDSNFYVSKSFFEKVQGLCEKQGCGIDDALFQGLVAWVGLQESAHVRECYCRC